MREFSSFSILGILGSWGSTKGTAHFVFGGGQGNWGIGRNQFVHYINRVGFGLLGLVFRISGLGFRV